MPEDLNDRMRRFLLIALTSNQDGEARNALKMFRKAATTAGLSEYDVADRVIGKVSAGARNTSSAGFGSGFDAEEFVRKWQHNQEQERAQRQKRHPHVGFASWVVASYLAYLTEWEQDFIHDMVNWTGNPTPRQAEVLSRIQNKLAARGHQWKAA